MQTMRTRIATRCRRAFTLVELVTAMAITAVLVVVIMQLTNHSISLWKILREDTSSADTSRLALQTLSRDLESFQMRSDDSNKFQWFFSEVDTPMRGVPRGLSIPRSARCVFFACAPDRNPAVSSTPASMRSSYRDMRASSDKYQGDVSAIGYRLLFRDHILNLPARNGDTETFPLFSLYRNIVSPRDTFENLLCKDDLRSSYSQYQSSEEKHFLCENIIELSITFTIQYLDESSGSGDESGSPTYLTMQVPLLSSNANRGVRSFSLYSDHAEMEGGRNLQNARIVSAEISMTVLTEEGVALVEQVRQGQRRAPKLEDFFSRYTRSFSRSVALPQPL